MANTPLAAEYEATIWSWDYAIPAGGTVETVTLSTTAGFTFVPTSADAMVYVYNQDTTASKTVAIGLKTSTSTSISAYTTVAKVAAGGYAKRILGYGGGAILLTAAASVTATIAYWDCSKTAAT